jgi:hypothetical protein
MTVDVYDMRRKARVGRLLADTDEDLQAFAARRKWHCPDGSGSRRRHHN